MTNHKKSIFKNIITNNSLSETRNSDEIESEASILINAIKKLTPTSTCMNPANDFFNKVSQNNFPATIELVPNLESLPICVKAYIEQHCLPDVLVIQPCDDLIKLEWYGLNIKTQANANEMICITKGEHGIAETGSVIINSGPDSPVLFNFLPDYHIIVLDKEKIYARLEDYADETTLAFPARTTCLITGASGTTDIEGVLVNGAHGPRHLHIVLIG